MFQPQPTPYATFASSAIFKHAEGGQRYDSQESAHSQQLRFDSGGPFLFENPTFSTTGAPSSFRSAKARHNIMASMDVADEVAAQQAAAANYRPALTGPLVGEKKSSHAITAEYAKADPIYVAKTAALPHSYSHYRQILGDGNCGWRAIAFSYFEKLQKAGTPERIAEERVRLSKMKQFIVNFTGSEEWVFEDMYEEVDMLLKLVSESLHQIHDDGQASVISQRFNDPEISNAMLYYFRLMTGACLKANASSYDGFIPDGNTVDTYSATVLQVPNTEIDHLGLMLLIDVLLKPAGMAVEIVYLDLSEGTQVNSHVFQELDANDVPINPSGPLIHLLYRPGHYDILYKEGSINNSHNSPHPRDIPTSIRVNRAASFTPENHIRPMGHNPSNSPDTWSLLTTLPYLDSQIADQPFDPAFSLLPAFEQDSLCSPLYALDAPSSNSLSISPISPIATTVNTNLAFPSDGTVLAMHPLPVGLNTPGPPIALNVDPNIADSLLTTLGHGVPIPRTQSMSQIPQDLGAISALSNSIEPQIRRSHYELHHDWTESPPPFQTNTFKNSHFNTAHYNNPNFQPEEWTPGCDEVTERYRTGRQRSAQW